MTHTHIYIWVHIYIFSGMLRGGCQNYLRFSASQWGQVPFSTVGTLILVLGRWVPEYPWVCISVFQTQTHGQSVGNGHTYSREASPFVFRPFLLSFHWQQRWERPYMKILALIILTKSVIFSKVLAIQSCCTAPEWMNPRRFWQHCSFALKQHRSNLIFFFGACRQNGAVHKNCIRAYILKAGFARTCFHVNCDGYSDESALVQ